MTALPKLVRCDQRQLETRLTKQFETRIKMLDRKQLPAFPNQCRMDKPSHASQQNTLQEPGNKNLQIKRNDHILNHQTNDVLVTEKRKKKIDQVATQHNPISRLLQPYV